MRLSNSAGFPVLGLPDGDEERHLLVLAVKGAVEVEVEGGKGVLLVEVEAVGEVEVAGRGGEAVAVLSGAVVVGIVVVEDLLVAHRVVAPIVVASDALTHGVDDGEGER